MDNQGAGTLEMGIRGVEIGAFEIGHHVTGDPRTPRAGNCGALQTPLKGDLGSKFLGSGDHQAGALNHHIEVLENFAADAPEDGICDAEAYRVRNHDALETLAGIHVAGDQKAF